MRFIHTADIHLDSPLTGLSAYADAPTELLRTATREAFENLVGEAVAEAVDFMVIAGDLYDGSWKDFNTGIHFARQMGRLKAAGIPVYLLLGNHDAESDMTRKLVLPDNVHKFPTGKAGTFRIPELRVALHGRSFKDAATTENLAVHYPDPVPGWLNIGVLHTALEGNAAHANYAPCSLAELQARGYQYWALGHVHEHKVWREGEDRGGAVIAYPGNLQGRHIREAGPRGALLVTADDEDGRITAVERLVVDVLRWHALEVDVAACANLAEAVRTVGRALEALANGAGSVAGECAGECADDGAAPGVRGGPGQGGAAHGGRPLAVRVTLRGATAAHGELFGLEAQLRAEVLAQAAALGAGRLWVEKVRLATTPLQAGADLAERADALADLQQLLARADQDADFLQALQDELMVLVGKLPFELNEALPQLADIRQGRLQALVRATAPSLLAHLAQAG